MIEDATRAQVRAADPAASSWVSANAGTGKTRVLTDRVARLLLSGCEPQKILCLTYTKAAAAEMQNRLFRTLGTWAMLPDAALAAALAELGETPAADLPRARTLFARALETPGGLRIQTIHAFCEALIRRFPLEAGVPPQFGVLEDRQARALREDILDALAKADPASFAALARQLPGDDPDPLLLEIAKHRDAFATPFDGPALARALGAQPEITPADLAARLLTPDVEALLRQIVPHLAASGKTDAKCGQALAAALAATDPNTRLAELESALLTGDGTAKAGKFPTKPLRARLSPLLPALDAFMTCVEATRTLRLANAAFHRSAELDRFARRWLAALARRKAALGLLDFDDLIDRARALLAQPGTAAWVLWRLDGGLDHILVDEAQDTSPAQWQVIQALTAEFFAGEGARETRRTVFVVGDEKQSIYSFQGADPDEFAAKRAHYLRAIADVGSALQDCALLHSFRSAPPILALVDAVFAGPAGARLAPGITHLAIGPDRPGRVEVWPFLGKPDKPEEPPWDAPVDARAPDDPVETLARRIADEIAAWLAQARALPGADRAIRPGDVMILVQRRGDLFHAVIRHLKRAGVPVAGADLLRMGGELAVNDLLAALRFAATPSDDLSLAALLRSPLGGLTERELFDLAHPRTGTLWQALRTDPRWPGLRTLLEDLLAQADYLRPHELLARILVRHDGRRKLLARLGAEAEDGIDALIDQSLAYETVEPPSLTGFIAWFDHAEVEVKRRTEETADQVRVMTVHGAKGLEAPIVILPDTATRSDAQNPPQILRLETGQAVWKVAADSAPAAFAQAEAARRQLVREESRRLLYVALTRPRTWLIVCGAGSDAATPTGESWHALIAEAVASLPHARAPGPFGSAGGDTLTLSHNWPDPTPAPRTATPEPQPLPEWAARPARTPASAPRPLSPSGLGGVHILPGEPGFLLTEEEALARGTAIHRLLEHLHGHPQAARATLAQRLLPATPGLDALLAEVEAVLDAPGLAFLFAPGTLAEVDVTAPLPELGGTRILGRIDRLVVEPARILAVDFKSHQAVPPTPEATPEGILRQMGAYAAALAPIFPGRRIETAILWTRTARLMPLPDALAAAALARAAAEP
ncbi:double-strand break repair helicase AddA [uncultured Amaricoccus sp.]|uniref:double-strand break repair helicase AddA n=1 Tax=uncultured Amaricoccus sp. TaxID=339341 RepID=UPI00345D41BF